MCYFPYVRGDTFPYARGDTFPYVREGTEITSTMSCVPISIIPFIRRCHL